jgi:hypothetical protein
MEVGRWGDGEMERWGFKAKKGQTIRLPLVESRNLKYERFI